MLFQLFSWHIYRIVIMQVLVYAGDMLHVVEHFGYIVTDDDDGALLVDLLQHLVHLLLESAVDVGVRLIENHDIGFGYDGTGEEHSLKLTTAEGSDVSVFQFRQLHALQGIEHLLVLRLGVSRKETFGLAESGKYNFIYRDRKLLVELVVLWEIAHRNLLYFLNFCFAVFIKNRFSVLILYFSEVSDGSFRRFHQSQNEAHEGSLATTVWSDDAKIIVLIYGEIYVAEHLLSVISGR